MTLTLHFFFFFIPDKSDEKDITVDIIASVVSLVVGIIVIIAGYFAYKRYVSLQVISVLLLTMVRFCLFVVLCCVVCFILFFVCLLVSFF